MSDRRDDTAGFRSDFYRECYHKVLRWVIIEIVIMFFLIAAIMYVLLSLKAPAYYATTIGGQLIPLVGMS